MKRPGLSDKQIAGLERKAKRYIRPDPEQRGLYLRIPPKGPITFAVVARGPGGKQIWSTVGTTADINITEARSKAREAVSRIKGGKPPVEPPKAQPDSVAAVAENWLKRVVDAKRYRTADETRRIVKKYIIPHLGQRVFVELKRSELTAWLDVIEDEHGPRMADRACATLKTIAHWVQSRGDDYTPPFAKGMRRANTNGRERILTDAEIKSFWKSTETIGGRGDCLRLLLLTAQRKAKVLGMRWQDVNPEGVWTIPSAEREKGTGGALKLPELALELIRKQLRMNSDDRVFPFRESVLDQTSAAVSNGNGWHIHDLRRTARSLMSRAGVQSEHAERVLGHVIPGVEGIYNRHAYEAEKATALAKLAKQIELIVA
jgi:integrase